MISVIMAAYNASEFIAQAIESILNQTYREFEFIIVDDGSTDNTLEIAKRYAEKDSRVRVIQSSHIGMSAVRNLGVSESKYPWIAIMDADDIALPEKFEKQIKAIQENPKVVGWSTYVYHINTRNEILSFSKWGITSEEEFYNARAEGHLPGFCVPTLVLNKEAFLKAGGYNPKYTHGEDLDLSDRMSQYGPILTVPEPLLLFRVHSKSASMTGFFHHKLMTTYLVDRHRKRLAGIKEELTFEEFVEQNRKEPALKRLQTYIYELGMFFYRKSGLLYGEKQYLPSVFYLTLATILSPQYSLRRVWNQVLSPESRKRIQQAAKAT
ncbi:glycosyltransferase family 2 protein [Phormidium sp. LEGE 05292]|uniref:glycosyltransferase family 2 protein n=1 Tax=[Phormidium] sp. LEGE 05292 TaxID=767427 RepID=UPI0018822DE2|nr:glycosyltransferase family 2 protein [Phormidium sp. LEGE 05292]MBE9228701.1 glycosyltransferase family 2 protein [Phormidium sp. LEGE 05292]